MHRSWKKKYLSLNPFYSEVAITFSFGIMWHCYGIDLEHEPYPWETAQANKIKAKIHVNYAANSRVSSLRLIHSSKQNVGHGLSHAQKISAHSNISIYLKLTYVLNVVRVSQAQLFSIYFITNSERTWLQYQTVEI